MLLGYWRDPSTSWIPWDTDADIIIDVSDLTHFLTINWEESLGEEAYNRWYP